MSNFGIFFWWGEGRGGVKWMAVLPKTEKSVLLQFGHFTLPSAPLNIHSVVFNMRSLFYPIGYRLVCSVFIHPAA